MTATLQLPWHELSERLFYQLTRNTNNCLHYLLPDIINRLRSAQQFPLIFAKTNKLKKFVHSLR